MSSVWIESFAPQPIAPVQTLQNEPALAADVTPRPAPSVPVAKIITKVTAQAQESHPELSSSPPPPTSQQKAQLIRKTLVKEHFSIVDLKVGLKEALLCMKELGGPELHPRFVECILTVMLESTGRETELVSSLFDYVHAERVFSSEAIRAGFLIAAEQLEHLAMDAPPTTSRPQDLKEESVKQPRGGAANSSPLAQPNNSPFPPLR